LYEIALWLHAGNIFAQSSNRYGQEQFLVIGTVKNSFLKHNSCVSMFFHGLDYIYFPPPTPITSPPPTPTGPSTKSDLKAHSFRYLLSENTIFDNRYRKECAFVELAPLITEKKNERRRKLSPPLNRLFEASFARDENSVSNAGFVVIPSQFKVTQEILLHLQSFRDLKLRYVGSRRVEQ
jgi:hypothetical protein